MHLVGAAKPSEVIAVCDEEDRAIVDPLVKEFEIPRCVFVTALSDATVEFLGEVLTGCGCSVDVAYCLDHFAVFDLVSLRGLGVPLKSGLVQMTRKAPTMSPSRFSSCYVAEILAAILVEKAETLPQ
jgi:hypothetical protein